MPRAHDSGLFCYLNCSGLFQDGATEQFFMLHVTVFSDMSCFLATVFAGVPPADTAGGWLKLPYLCAVYFPLHFPIYHLDSLLFHFGTEDRDFLSLSASFDLFCFRIPNFCCLRLGVNMPTLAYCWVPSAISLDCHCSCIPGRSRYAWNYLSRSGGVYGYSRLDFCCTPIFIPMCRFVLDEKRCP